MKIVDKACRPCFCFSAGAIAIRAGDDSADVYFSHVPFAADSLDHSSSKCLPVHGKKSALPENSPFPKKSPGIESIRFVVASLGASVGTWIVYGFGRPSFLAGVGTGAVSFGAAGLVRNRFRFGIG
jgi:hypothetical protein